ncbi:MAG: RlmE family RNA methyltransferase [Pseudomonadota bacterium]
MGRRRGKGRNWNVEHRTDAYVQKAATQGLRARSAFKLEEIDRRDRLFEGVTSVVDLGAAPGAWSEYARDAIEPNGAVFALDLLEMTPINDVTFIQGDCRDEGVLAALESAIGTGKIDLVLSDMAPNMGGIRVTDQARSMDLAELAAEFATRILRPGGDFLVKLFQGSGVEEYMKMLRSTYDKVLIRKPDASRSRSREFYALARGYRV